MWDVIFGVFSIGTGSYLVASTKDDAPNRKTIKGLGIFAIILGTFALAWGLFKMYVQRQGNVTFNPMYQPGEVENAVIGETPAPSVNVPNGTVIVNNPAPGNMGVGIRNNKK
jgi:hypothetical protein